LLIDGGSDGGSVGGSDGGSGNDFLILSRITSRSLFPLNGVNNIRLDPV
jgi:hypothetical protein